ncbi:MAG: hypothetical protein HDS68_04870 [Bacteroidales bacterium]|nr:hypothetical protein [Bacteroidales bacterium]
MDRTKLDEKSFKAKISMKKYLNILTLWIAAILAVAPAAAKNWDVCENPDEAPLYPGSIETAFPKFVERNFTYPKEVWATHKFEKLPVIALIGTKGKVLDFMVNSEEEIPEALIAEIGNTLAKTEWFPAWKDGQAVNAFVRFYFPLQTDVVKQNYTVPTGWRNQFEKTLRMIAQHSSSDKITPLSDSDLAQLKESSEMFNTYAPIPVFYAQALMSDKRNPEATAVMRHTIENYHQANTWTDKNDMPRFEPTYRGATDVWINILHALQHEYISSADTDSLLVASILLVKERLIDGYITPKTTMKAKLDARERAERLKKNMAGDILGRYFDNNTNTWDRVTSTMDIEELTARVSYSYDRVGVSRGAQIPQLASLINSAEFKGLTGYQKDAKGKDVLNMYGTMAFALWLREGEEGLRNYIASTNSGEASKQLKSYLAKLEKNYDRNAAALADRKGVIESLACLVPPQGTDEEGCRAFYERRRAAEKVFPIKWLKSN